MAHFAKIDENGTVCSAVVVANNEITDADGVESEAKGVAFCKSIFGENTNWVQTSYNGNFRARYAAVGGLYDAQKDIFIPPQPFPSWTINRDIGDWGPPVPKPLDDGQYRWDESQLLWVKFEPKLPA